MIVFDLILKQKYVKRCKQLEYYHEMCLKRKKKLIKI